METFKVAAATASVVAFHCVICFEEFNLQNRAPVVLPCGHTYVCAMCSKRLKRCMECREPLYIQVGKNPNGMNHHNNTGSSMQRRMGPGGRYSPTPSTPPPPNHQQQQQQQQQQIPLPMPKNVVLMAIIEAAQRQRSESNNLVDDSIVEEDDDYDERCDLNGILASTATLSGPCGTYAVKEKLLILPNDPRKNHTLKQHPSQQQHDDFDYEGSDTRMPEPTMALTSSISLSQSASGEIEVRNPDELVRGQTVQIVDFYDGVAKLARNAGYIHANSSQLVKIGPPLENSCRLEGLLDTVRKRGRDLQHELDENSRIEFCLLKEIEAEQGVYPNHPIVAEANQLNDAMNAHDQREAPMTPTNKRVDNQACLMPGYPLTPEISPNLIINRPMNSAHAEAADRGDFVMTSPNSIDNSDLGAGLPSYRMDTSTFDDTAYGCGVAFLGTTFPFGERNPDAENQTCNTLLPGLSYHSQLENKSSRARANSVEHNHDIPRSSQHHHHHHHWQPTVTASFDTIDFRTGMSGHRGLNNAKRLGQPHHYSPTTRTRYMMSEHRGISGSRRPQHKSSP